jgi:hypothetical protein
MIYFIPKISLDGKSRNINSRANAPIRAHSASQKLFTEKLTFSAETYVTNMHLL